MRISFIIPAHNEEDYLSRAIESILGEISRGEHRAEVIVVDNASTDGTAEVAKRYPNVSLITEKRKGTSFARLAGLRASRGTLVAFVDADTAITPGWIETALREFERSPALVGLSGPCRYEGFSAPVNFLIFLYYCALYATHVINHRVLRGSSVILFGNFAARRSALFKIGGFNTDITFYGDDTYVAKRLSKVGTVKFSFRFVAHTSARRFHAEGIVRTAARYVLNFVWVLFFDKPFSKTATDVRFTKDTEPPRS